MMSNSENVVLSSNERLYTALRQLIHRASEELGGFHSVVTLAEEILEMVPTHETGECRACKGTKWIQTGTPGERIPCDCDTGIDWSQFSRDELITLCEVRARQIAVLKHAQKALPDQVGAAPCDGHEWVSDARPETETCSKCGRIRGWAEGGPAPAQGK